jgi:hypothetical protein
MVSIDLRIHRYQLGMHCSLHFPQMRLFQKRKEYRLWNQLESMFLQGNLSMYRFVHRYQLGMECSLYFLHLRQIQQGRQDSLWNQQH